MTTGGPAPKPANGGNEPPVTDTGPLKVFIENGAAADRVARRRRLILFTLAGVALVLAGAAFTVALAQAAQSRAALAAEVRRHCVEDAMTKNRQRALDLALLDADQDALKIAAKDLPTAVDPVMLRAQIIFYEQAIAARKADVLPYQDPRLC